MSDSPVVVTDPRLPPDKFIFEGIDTSAEPTFTVSELAKFFFGKSAHWVRWREGRNFFVLDGDPNCAHGQQGTVALFQESTGEPVLDDDGIQIEREQFVSALVDGVCPRCGGVEVANRRTPSKNGKPGSRTYDLADIEKVAHALAQRGALDRAQLTNALLLVQTQGRVWGYI